MIPEMIAKNGPPVRGEASPPARFWYHAAMGKRRGGRAVLPRAEVLCVGTELVAGKTNTIYPWKDSWPGIKNRLRSSIDPSRAVEAEPDPWFHDLFHPDGTPYDEAEIALFKKLSP